MDREERAASEARLESMPMPFPTCKRLEECTSVDKVLIVKLLFLVNCSKNLFLK